MGECFWEEARENQGGLPGRVFKLNPESQMGFRLADEWKLKSYSWVNMDQDWEQGNNGNNNNDNNSNFSVLSIHAHYCNKRFI